MCKVSEKKLLENWMRIQDNIYHTLSKAGRSDTPRLVVASKYMTVEQIRFLYSLGLRLFGENRAQDFLKKKSQLKDLAIEWHFIGHLQTNKVRYLVDESVSMIHSIDSNGLVSVLSKWAKKKNRLIECLIEVNLSGEKSKYGVTENELEELIDLVNSSSNLRCVGIMTMAPYTQEEGVIRQVFSRARILKEKFALSELSMGMSNDYTIALEEGATLLRIGSAFLS